MAPINNTVFTFARITVSALKSSLYQTQIYAAPISRTNQSRFALFIAPSTSNGDQRKTVLHIINPSNFLNGRYNSVIILEELLLKNIIYYVVDYLILKWRNENVCTKTLATHWLLSRYGDLLNTQT
jgi:hypothetical protein